MMDQQDQTRISSFQTWKEEAEFWDSHDTTEFEDEFEPVEVTFARPLLRHGLAIPLDSWAIELLRRFAREQRMEPTALARRWILDRLRAETARTV